MLSKNKFDKILKNQKRLGLLLHEFDPNMIYSFADKDDKIVKPPRCGVSWFSFAYISV